MSTETTNKKIKIDNGTTFGRTYTDKAVDERLQGLVSTATFTPVKEKADNSLQKPKGLTDTVLIAFGRYGQEIVSIGDNLELNGGTLSARLYSHFITLTNDTSTFYFTYQNTSGDKLNTLYSLQTALTGKYLLCNGHTATELAEYIQVDRGNIEVGVVDSSDHSTLGIIIDSSFTITDDVTPV